MFLLSYRNTSGSLGEWECCGIMSHRRVFLHLFRVLPNFLEKIWSNLWFVFNYDSQPFFCLIFCRDSSYCSRVLFPSPQTCKCQVPFGDFCHCVCCLLNPQSSGKDANCSSQHYSCVGNTFCHLHVFKLLWDYWRSCLWTSKLSGICHVSWFARCRLVSLHLGWRKFISYV